MVASDIATDFLTLLLPLPMVWCSSCAQRAGRADWALDLEDADAFREEAGCGVNLRY